MGLDLTKPVQTRDGRKARILCTDAGGTAPIIALVRQNGVREDMYRYLADGRLSQTGVFREDPLDLVNVSEIERLYAVVYPLRPRPGSPVWRRPTYESAAELAGERGAVLEIIYEDGVPKKAILTPASPCQIID